MTFAEVVETFGHDPERIAWEKRILNQLRSLGAAILREERVPNGMVVSYRAYGGVSVEDVFYKYNHVSADTPLTAQFHIPRVA